MAVTAATSAPYAPPTAVLEVIDRFRHGLPAPIDGGVLARAGISESLIPRTLQALQTLDLITDEGAATPTLEGLRRAPEPEFQKRMAEWLDEAYADVRSFIDPATATETAIRDAFRAYNPVGQQPRMVTLYVGLYAAAGVRSNEKSATPRASASRARGGRTRTSSSARQTTTTARAAAKNVTTGDLPPALAGLMASLPREGAGWTQETRNKFIALFGSTLDFCIPIISRADADRSESDAE